jgi:DNA-binding transcriptional MerR regulator
VSTISYWIAPAATVPGTVSIVAVSDRSIYSIGALARVLGVSPATLRSWEDRYGLVVPERSAGAQRLYSRDHLDQLTFVREQMQLGLSAADAHRALAERLADGNHQFGVATGVGASGDRSILLVERDPYAADLAEYFLRTEGYDVQVARAVADAEELVRERTLDLAIVDLMIGGGAGLAFCDQLAGTIPVLAVSVLDQNDRALRAGAQAFLRKPFDSLTLVSTARDLIGTSALVRRTSPVLSG